MCIILCIWFQRLVCALLVSAVRLKLFELEVNYVWLRE